MSESKMRICIISPYSPLAVTGIGTFIVELARALKKVGHECVVMAPETDIPYAEQDFLGLKEGLQQIRISRFPIFRDLFLAVSTALRLIRQRKSIGVIHVQQPHIQSIVAAKTGNLLGIPVVATYHLKVPRPRGWLRRWLLLFSEKNLHRFCSQAVFVSYDAKKDFGLEEGVVIWNGVDTEKYRPDASSREEMRKQLNLDGQIVLLFGSRWAKIKGIDETLRAFQKAKSGTKANMALVLTGGGEKEFEDKVKSDIKEMDLGDSVKAVGRVKEIIGYYHLSDVYLLPSYSEGFSIALIEAMASGLPPIASAVGGNPEAIENGVDGILVKAGDIEDLSRQIERLSGDDALRTKIAKAARDKVKREFSLEIMTQRYVDVYESLARKSARMSSSKQN
ncbi:MAG: glycosyltransferase family 1 protein [Methanomassiliicoccales archaeon]|nr:MAG: glycosyltransferase family 1 protein [Methanomassiliicoccales archaeon]